METQDAITAYREGDPQAFQEVLRQHRGYVRNIVAYMGLRGADLDDLTQDVFIHVSTHIDQFRPDGNFRSWLWGITRNQCMTWLKKQRSETLKREMAEALMSRVNRYSADVLQHDLITTLEDCLEKLSAPNRTLLAARYSGVPLKTLAEERNRSVTAVKQTLFRVRNQLKTCMEDTMRNEPLTEIDHAADLHGLDCLLALYYVEHPQKVPPETVSNRPDISPESARQLPIWLWLAAAILLGLGTLWWGLQTDFQPDPVTPAPDVQGTWGREEVKAGETKPVAEKPAEKVDGKLVLSEEQQKQALRRKMSTLVQHRVVFDQMPLRAAIAELNKMTVTSDPEAKGIPIVLENTIKNPDMPLHISVGGVVFAELLQYISDMASLSFRVEADKVVLCSPAGLQQIRKKTYAASADLFDLRNVPHKNHVYDIKTYFIDFMDFPEGTAAEYLPDSEQVSVTHYDWGHEAIKDLLSVMKEDGLSLRTERHLKRIKFPIIRFNQTEMHEVLDQLREMTSRKGPKGEEIRFTLDTSIHKNGRNAVKDLPSVTLDLKDVSLESVIYKIIRQTGMEIQISQNEIIFSRVLFTRSYPMPAGSLTKGVTPDGKISFVHLLQAANLKIFGASIAFKPALGHVEITHNLRYHDDILPVVLAMNDHATHLTFNRMKAITMPEITLEKRSLQEVIRHFKKISAAFDPNKTGFDFVLSEGVNKQLLVDMQIKGGTFEEALQALMSQTALAYRIEKGAIIISGKGRLLTRWYALPKDVITGTEKEQGGHTTRDVSGLFSKNGVTFPPGTLAEYAPGANILITLNTPENTDSIEKILLKMIQSKLKVDEQRAAKLLLKDPQ